MQRSLVLTFAFSLTTAAAVLAGLAANNLIAQDALPPVALKRDATPLERNGPRIVSFADVLENVTPAVVSVHSSFHAERSNRDQQMENMLRRYYGLPDAAPEDTVIQQGLGSGFIVTADGYVLTNNHVIAGRRGVQADDIVVQLEDGREFDAVVVGSDPNSDVAVLKIDAKDEKLPFLPVGDSSQLRVGDIVFAVGNPLSVGMTVTQGIVSALERTELGIYGNRRGPGMESFIQTDAAINMGNSGGPLIDAQGRVIGINSAIASPTGGSIGIGFAIPINLAAQIMDSLVTDGQIRRGFIGVELAPLDRQLAEAFGLDSSRGALINRVNPGLPGDQAGLQHGDVVVGVDGQNVDSVRELIYLISTRPPESTVMLSIVRDKAKQDVKVTLGDRDSLMGGMPLPARERPPEPEPTQYQVLAKGLEVSPLTDELRAQYSIPAEVQGIVITEVGEGPGREAFAPGQVIESINGKAVTNAESGRQALKPGANRLYVYVDEYHRYVPLIIEKTE